ncbi:MAG: DNA methyltransferase [Elusimicrobia bacterium]|nr:DNA methyltransferase [Elusimicrobiota bacterium]
MRNRLHSICPYFAMFPEEFVREHVEAHTHPGDYVLDPFSGRGTTILESLLLGRKAVAVDINPVAYCISKAKAEHPSLVKVQSRLKELKTLWLSMEQTPWIQLRDQMDEFFHRAFFHSTLLELLFLRQELKWKSDSVDRFIAALVLGSLHGERDKSPNYFSNQMPRTISTKPRYSLKYWRKHKLWPHKRDVFGILLSRAEYRLNDTCPTINGQVEMVDARRVSETFSDLKGKVKLAITSPPYFNVTNYEEDQWLRLWFLGYAPKPTYRTISRDDRHGNKKEYWRFLKDVWQGIAPLMAEDGIFVCRIGAKGIDRARLTRGINSSIRTSFPHAEIIGTPAVSKIKNRQTESFHPNTIGCSYEIDYVFQLGRFSEPAKSTPHPVSQLATN